MTDEDLHDLPPGPDAPAGSAGPGGETHPAIREYLRWMNDHPTGLPDGLLASALEAAAAAGNVELVEHLDGLWAARAEASARTFRPKGWDEAAWQEQLRAWRFEDSLEPDEERPSFEAPTEIPEGKRNVTLHKAGSSLRARGSTEAEIFAHLWAMNLERCKPPLGQREVKNIVRKSVVKYERGSRDLDPEPEGAAAAGRGPVSLRSMAGTSRKRVELLGGRLNIPLGTLAVLTGSQGDGKSLLTAAEASELTRAGYGVVFIAEEDSVETTILPRLQAAGAVLERCYFPEVERRDDLGGIVLPKHADHLAVLARERNVRLVVVDPWTNHLGDVDLDKGAVRQALMPMVAASRDGGFSTLLIAHPNKNTSDPNPLNQIAHASAVSQLARSAFWLVVDPDGPERRDENHSRLVCQIKENLTQRAKTLRYRIEIVNLPETAEEPEADVPVLVHVGTSMLDWVEIGKQRRAQAKEPRDTEQHRCAEWLLDYLDMFGAKPRPEIVVAASVEGYSRATLDRAREWLVGLKALRSIHKPPNAAVWELTPAGLARARGKRKS